MADITKCTHTGCRQALYCYRKRAVDSDPQSWAELYEPHPSDPSVPCLNFWPLEGRKNIEPLKQE